MRFRRLALVVLLGVVSVPSFATAQQVDCSFEVLLSPPGDQVGPGPLDVLLLDNDPVAVHGARVMVDSVLDACVGKDPALPNGPVFQGLYEPYRPTLRGTVERFLAERKTSSPLFSSVLGGGGVPVAPKAQVGLSQVVTAGQLGFLASLSGNFWPTHRQAWRRHLTVAGSVLMVQPSSPDPGKTTPDPQLGALDLLVGYDSRRTPYDWSAEYADKAVADLDFYEAPGREATLTMLHLYQEQRTTLLALKDASASEVESRLDAAISRASATARKQYADTIAIRFKRSYIDPEIERERNNHYWSLAARVRYSDDTRFVPELPDLLSAGLDITGHTTLVGRDTTLGLRANVHGGFSRHPASICPTRQTPGCQSQGAALVDATSGFAFTMGQGSGSPTVLNVGGIFRYRLGERVATDSGTKRDYSGGVLASLQVPLGSGVALVGTYSVRWFSWSDKVTTSSLSISKALGNPETPTGLK